MQKKRAVNRARELEKLLAIRCRVAVDENAPTFQETINATIGGQSMLKGRARELCVDALKRKGMVPTMTLKEKYEKAFEKLTLTPKQIDLDIKERRSTLR